MEKPKKGLALVSKEIVLKVAKTGGDATLQKYGRDHYIALGRKGGSAVREKYSVDHFKEIGAKGGAAAAAIIGKEGYSAMGRVGGKFRKKKSTGDNGNADTSVTPVSTGNADNRSDGSK